MDAINNQVSLFFIKSKNTASVVALANVLYYKYHKYSKLYFTWDCASWHKSNGLESHLAKLNGIKGGPKIEAIQLPRRSQFLNIIEAVFSGMKKAVILNSDYDSEFEMKMVIIRHFQERNKFYKENPKRTGNKIWDKELYNLDEFDGGVYKKV